MKSTPPNQKIPKKPKAKNPTKNTHKKAPTHKTNKQAKWLLVLKDSRFEIRYWNFRRSSIERKLTVWGIFSAPVCKKPPRGISEIGLLSCTEAMAVSQEANYCNKLRIWRLGDSKIVSRLLGVRGSTEEWVEQGKIAQDEMNSTFYFPDKSQWQSFTPLSSTWNTKYLRSHAPNS